MGSGVAYWLANIQGSKPRSVKKIEFRLDNVASHKPSFLYHWSWKFQLEIYVDGVKWTSLFYPSSTYKIYWTTWNLVYEPVAYIAIQIQIRKIISLAWIWTHNPYGTSLRRYQQSCPKWIQNNFYFFKYFTNQVQGSPLYLDIKQIKTWLVM